MGAPYKVIPSWHVGAGWILGNWQAAFSPAHHSDLPRGEVPTNCEYRLPHVGRVIGAPSTPQIQIEN
jgi:hypothetical protein